MRNAFKDAYGKDLPEDVCLSMADMPTRWQVIPEKSGPEETLADIDADILADVSLMSGYLRDLTHGARLFIRLLVGFRPQRAPLALVRVYEYCLLWRGPVKLVDN
jgi:hypothetical protein